MHAANPVAWQPWDRSALQRARDTDTPILLSIGYSACHWCHVMARECFESSDIAAAMNRGFVSIKLDREERPDIDRVYQLAHQALTGRGGGWPLTAFLDPQTLSPFYIGTYFPPTPRHGLPDFAEVLQRVRAYFDNHRDELREHADALRDWLQRAEAGDDDSTPGAGAASARALQRIRARFDPDFGGSRGAPKFPRATELEWLLDPSPFGRSWRAAPDEGSELPYPHPSPDGRRVPAMAQLTLANMAARGLQDHLGGGFFRYCVDADWTIPHFEKMLYDNAQLLPVYARAAASCSADAALRHTCAAAAHGIVDWLARDMTAPNGAFFSSLDADSEHEEGKYYLWTREQVRAALPEAVLPVAEQAFGLDRPPNFEGRAWHFLRVAPLDSIAWQLGRSPDAIESEYALIRRRLLDARAQRQHPARDDKILTAWNALAISGLARSARMLDDARCAGMARRALAALRETVWIDGELFANAAAPAARIPGFLDDHAFLLDALLETLQCEFDAHDLGWAVALADAMCDKFLDRATGSFWFSAREHATPLARGRNFSEDALPNGNGIAIGALLRLGHLTGDTRYPGIAERALGAASGALRQYPDACISVLRALLEFEQPRIRIVIRCTRDQQADWRTALRDAMTGIAGDPADVFVVPAECGALPGLPPAREPHGGGTAYVCCGLACQAPVVTPAALADALHAARYS
jgi:uncharacterized protein YyaL (SSP411 family)